MAVLKHTTPGQCARDANAGAFDAQRPSRRKALARLMAGVLALPGRAAVPSVALVALSSCTTVSVQAPPRVERGASWALLPITNHTETPQAGLRAESIVESLVRTGGLRQLRRYPASLNNESTFEPAERRAVEQAMAWARNEQIRYVITGAVDEWRYKVGVDGEPAVGITLQVVDLSNGAVIWTAAGSRSGWSREALSAVAHKLIAELTAPLRTQTTRSGFW